MKTQSFLLMSIFSFADNTENINRIKESLLDVAEEVGAWLLAGGFLFGIFRVAEILFGAN